MVRNLAERMAHISPFYVMALLQRAKQLEQQGKDIIHLEIGEPDFPSPQQIVSAGLDFIRHGQVKYTAAAGLLQLREKISAYYQDTYQVNVAPERIFITPGASGAFLLALGATLNPDDELLMADPCYPCNSNFVSLFNAKTRFIPVNADTDYQLTAGSIKQHWGKRTKGALIASPSNPTGTLIPHVALAQAIAQVHELGGCFFSDEIYHGLVYEQKASSALQFSEQVFVINSFSKYFGMTGWRVGWLIVPEAFIEATEKLAQNLFISSPTHSQYAALAAFQSDTLQELEQRRLEFAQRRDFLYQGLKNLGFEIAQKPAGAFYIYANCSRFTDDSFQFAYDLLEHTGVAITPGKDFGSHRANEFVRFAYTTSIERMTDALDRVAKFIKYQV